MELVSIIVTCYNKEKFIAQTIESVLNQTYTNFELIIIDDGSVDNSRAIIEQFADKRIKFISQNNCGETQARNAGIKFATGSWLAFLDGDDVWLPTKLQEQLNYIQINNLDMCFCDYATIDEIGELNMSFSKVSFPNFTYNSLRKKILAGNVVLGSASSVIVKNDIIKKIGFFDPDIKWGGDWEYWIRIVFCTDRVGFLNKELTLLRFGITQVQSTLNMAKRLIDTLKILNKSLTTYKLNNKERAIVYLSECKVRYNYHSNYKNLLKAFFNAIKEDFMSIARFDIIWLLIKYPLRKLIKTK
jgi:glycosyltransferase involved in cell wall biosynthesis